jgi:polygalacturonase
MDKCGKGRAVMLHVNEADNAFLSGPLELRPDVTLIVGVGVTLFASRDPALFAVSPGSCGIVSHSPGPRGCKPLISVDHAPDSAIMGDGVIDGRGGEKMLGSEYSWWDLAEQARAGGGQQVPRLIVANDSGNFTLYRITLKNSPNFHVVFNHADGFTVWGLKIDTPQRLARNTDGVDPGNGARNITITHSYIRTGDDNVAIKGGTAGGGPGGATSITISHDHFYWGHGMSIGSETNGGVSKIRVFDLSLDGPDNGIRIKSNGSRGGLTEDVVYDDVCIRNSPNPITLDTAYSANGPLQGDSLPTMRGITLHNVRVSGGGKITFNGYDPTHRIAATLDGVQIVDQSSYTYQLNHADLALGPGATNLQLLAPDATKNDSTIKGSPAEGDPASCADKFVPFPQ